MDFTALNDRLNTALNAWYENARAYFSDLNQREVYGWIGEGAGFLLLLAGIILLL